MTEDFWVNLKNFDPGEPDPSEFIVEHVFNRTGIPHTDECKEKARLRTRKHWEMGRFSEERNKKIGDALRGRKRPQHTIDNVTKGLCKNIYTLIHESGEVVVTDNLASFCREHKLHPQRMKERLTGQKTKLYHGWTGHYEKKVL